MHRLAQLDAGLRRENWIRPVGPSPATKTSSSLDIPPADVGFRLLILFRRTFERLGST